jgi:hypothetical protein
MLGVMFVLMLSVISLSIGDQSIINDVSSISSQFTLSDGLHPTVDEIYWCC